MKINLEPPKETLITQIQSFQQFEANGRSLKNCTLQALDFTKMIVDWSTMKIDNTTFLGCQLNPEDEILLRKKGAYIYTAPKSLPYNPFRHQLYTWQELMEPIYSEKEDTLDFHIYEHFSAARFNPTINEALWQRIHDHAMDDALRQLLGIGHKGMTDRKCVGFMGGHGVLRNDPFYHKTAYAAKLLAENGYFIVSGGGPGIMEATNLGAYLAGRSNKVLENALRLLEQAPHYTHANYIKQARQVLEAYPEGKENLAIPTWFYGHEPSNLFASHIAKYFSNSIREDTLLAISLYGIVYAPGSAGTTQEIFMDAAQNHYGTFNYFSPMIFLGTKHYEIDTLIYPLLRQLAWDKAYFDLLHITDDPEEVLTFLQSHPPKKVD